MELTNDDRLYEALINRDARFEGRAFVAVLTTGIFCRLTCPARKPKRQNCRFFDSIDACIAAGFRACKKCRPDATSAHDGPMVSALISALKTQPDHRWSEDDVKALGFDPSTVRRTFKRIYGMTFIEMARQARLREGFQTLAQGGRIIEAQLDAGFESGSGFRAAFARMLGISPAHLADKTVLKADWIDTPIGPMVAVSDQRRLHLLEFGDRRALPGELKRLYKKVKGQIGIGRYAPIDQIEQELTAYFSGQEAQFQTPITMHGSTFSQRVWQALLTIPAGQTRSYKQIAMQIGQPTAVRAVARANGANQLALIIPCHRVIGSDGSMTGYGGGLWRKEKLIALEAGYARGP